MENSKLNVLKKKPVNILLGNSHFKETVFEAPGERASTWTFSNQNGCSKNIYLQRKRGREPGLFCAEDTHCALRVLVPGSQTPYRKLAWALFVLASGENCLFSFVLFFRLRWSHLFLIFPLPPWFSLQVSQGLSNLHTDDRRQDSQGVGRVCTLRGQRRGFWSSRQSPPVTQAQELRPGLERSRPVLGKLQKHTCSFSNGIQALALFLRTQKFSCFVGGFLVALSATILPFHSGLLSAFL